MPAAAARPAPTGRLAIGLFCGGWLALGACAADDCRIAYDMGSSGVRAGIDNAAAAVRWQRCWRISATETASPCW